MLENIMRITWQKILLIIAVILIAVSVFLAISWQKFLETPLSNKPVVFMVAPGSSVKTISEQLHHLGVLKHPYYFIVLAYVNGVSKQIKAGEYQVDPNSTPKQLLFKLAKGKVLLHHFTIVEGWNLQQILASVNRNQFLRHCLNQNTLQQLTTKLGCQNKNLEGYLFPDTYLFARDVKDTIIIGKAFALMQKKLTNAWQGRDTSLPYKTPYEVLIVASLIEKETARADERPKISGVILRRLKQNMPLQIDASVIYGLGDLYQGKITKSDLKIDTPYNIYLHLGLPPSPIAMPSLASIMAALHPQAGTELYYVARGDGSHEFTNTLEEHHKAIRKYRVNYLEDLQNLEFSQQHDAFSNSDRVLDWYSQSIPVEKKLTSTSTKKTTATSKKTKKPSKSVSKKPISKRAKKGKERAQK